MPIEPGWAVGGIKEDTLAFELYEGRGTKGPTPYLPVVAITSKGKFCLNKVATLKFKEGDKDHALIYYDKDTHHFLIMPFPENQNAFPVTVGKTSSCAWFSSKGFLDHFKIPLYGTTRITLSWDDVNKRFEGVMPEEEQDL